jgi:hypothetical protein
MLSSGPKTAGFCSSPDTNALQSIQEFERFVVAAALKIMRQLRIDWTWQCRLQFVDLFRNGAQLLHMRFRVAPTLFIRNDGETFS